MTTILSEEPPVQVEANERVSLAGSGRGSGTSHSRSRTRLSSDVDARFLDIDTCSHFHIGHRIYGLLLLECINRARSFSTLLMVPTGFHRFHR